MNALRNITRWAGATMVGLSLFSLPVLAQNAPKLTDPEIASVAVTANQIDVNYGKIALKKSKKADIRKFAQTMINDHTNIIKEAVALAGKLGVTPKDNAMTEQLLAGAKKEKAKLNSASRKDFNKIYIDNEVAYHEAVISAVKNVLIPQTQNAQLKALLVEVSPILNAHLKMAKAIQEKYK